MSDMNALVAVEVERLINSPEAFLAVLQKAVIEKKRAEEEKDRLVKVVESRERELEALVPVKAFYDAVTEAVDWMEMAAAVKVIGHKGWGWNKVFALLRDRQIFRYNNEPYQQYVERGYFKTVEELFEDAYGRSGIYRKAMVSNKGLEFIKKLIDAEATA